jgi:rhodanese-related sulfurtransferase
MEAWERAGLPIDRAQLLTMRQVRARLEGGDAVVVVDVRQAHEWATGHIPHAELVEAGALPTADDVHLPHDRLIATHCGHGQRAATGLSVLERRGYHNLAVITEGLDEWRKAGGPVDQDRQPQEPARA